MRFNIKKKLKENSKEVKNFMTMNSEELKISLKNKTDKIENTNNTTLSNLLYIENLQEELNFIKYNVINNSTNN